MIHCQLFKPSIVGSVRRKYTIVHSFFFLFEGSMVLLLFAFIIAVSVNYFVFMVVSSIVS